MIPCRHAGQATAAIIGGLIRWLDELMATHDHGSTAKNAGTPVLAGAPGVGNTFPASTPWWDGFSIAANSDLAVWLMPGYPPGLAAAGVFSAANAGAVPPFADLLHTAPGDAMAESLQGQESAEQALAVADAANSNAARARGFLRHPASGPGFARAPIPRAPIHCDAQSL